MGNWSFSGILLIIGVFFVIFGFVLTQINITNPYTGAESSVITTILDWLYPLWY